jgi:hypothetical protein
MKMKRLPIAIAFGYGLAAAVAVVMLMGYWWPHFWVPFVIMTVLTYIVCRLIGRRPLLVGFVAALPGLFIPAYLWWLVLFMWQGVVEARAEGGLYTIMTLGDPHSVKTIALFLVLPSVLVFTSGLSAGALARVLNRIERMKSSNTDLEHICT